MSELVGYTKLKNEILAALCCAGLNGTELSVALFVIRKTYGFRKKSDRIPASQFVVAIGVSRRSIFNALESLKVMKILSLVKKGSSGGMASEWALNKKTETWTVVKKTALVQKRTKRSEGNCTNVVKETAPSKETTKEKTKERERSKHRLFGWINESCPDVQKMDIPLTDKHIESLLLDFPEKIVKDKLMYLGNTPKYISGKDRKKSANLTIRNWLAKDGYYRRSDLEAKSIYALRHLEARVMPAQSRILKEIMSQKDE